MRLIDADKLLDALYDTEYSSYVALDEVSEVVNNAPTVDAEPVKHGTGGQTMAYVSWHKITTRPLLDEEKERYIELGYEPFEIPELFYDCVMPEDGQEILIATPWGTDKDICCFDEYGCGLEGRGDFDDVLAWAELPQYKEEKE